MPYTRPSFLRLRAFPEEGQRCCLAESLVWSVGVVDILPSAKKLVDLGERGGRCKAVVELLLVSTLGTLDVAVELGRARWKDKEFDAARAAGVLELGHELGAAVDLDRSDREGHALEDRIQEAGRGVSRGAAMCLQDLPAGEDVAGGEVLEREPGEEGDVSGVHLDDGAGVIRQVLFGLSDAVWTQEGTARMPGISAGGFNQPAGLLEVSQDAADHRGRALPALVAEQDDELVLAPAWGKLPQLQDGVLQTLRPRRRPDVVGPVAPVLQTTRPVPLEAPKPAIERIARDAEVSAAERSVPFVLLIPRHHAQPVLSLPGELKSPDGTHRPRDVQPKVSHTRYNAGVRHLSERTQGQG